MSAEEFIEWQGYLRQSPVGWRWLNLRLAEVMRELAKARVSRGKPWPPLDDFIWKPPEPLFVTRQKDEAKAARAKGKKR
jgi:hypothetical protein